MVTMPKRLGMFIHWGPYALHGWQEQERMRLGLDRKTYEDAAAAFSPERFDAEKIVKLARDAGMEYICFTTKHHDGFCMWDTAETNFNIRKTSGRDVLRELSEACEKYGVALSLYYSIPDWHHPCGYNPHSTHQCPPEPGDTPDSERYRAYVKAQVRELLTKYGKIYTWFWDIPPKIEDPSLNALVRSLQPDILINDRGYSAGDFSTPERCVPDGDSFPRYTEACQSVGQSSWGYREAEDYFTPGFLARSMDKILLMGGSYLLNVGPDGYGEIPQKAAEIVRRIGLWYGAVREAYGEGIVPVPARNSGNYWVSGTEDGKTMYLHVKNPLSSTGLALPGWEENPAEVVLLNDGTQIAWDRVVNPEDFTGVFGVSRPPVLRLHGLPAEEQMPLILRIRY